MIGAKTDKGMAVLKDRTTRLSPRQRSAFILCDGKRYIDEVLELTRALGVTLDDIKVLFIEGLLEEVIGPSGFPAARGGGDGPASEIPPTGRSRQQRYQDAYPVAIKLTASLGLRGFRLNLAVERAGNYEQLKELAPRIQEAVGQAAFVELDRALFA
jgi:hypothetical protein